MVPRVVHNLQEAKYSYCCYVVVAMIVIDSVAIIDVNFVRNVPTDLDDVKLSCETPNPKAPPSDLCRSITMINTTAKMILIKISKLSIMLIYSNSLLYQ